MELENILADPESPVLKVWLARAMLKAIDKGDLSTLDLLLNRLIGKVREELSFDLQRPAIIEKLDGSQIILGSIEVAN